MPTPDHIQQAIHAYYAERITDEQLAALEDWLREDEANVRLFADLGMLEWQLLCEVEKADAAAILAILREAEGKAQPDFSLLQAPVLEPLEPKSDKGESSAHDLAAVGGYLLRQALTSKPAYFAYAAAIVLLAAVFIIPWGGSDAPSETPFVSHPREPGRDGPAQNNATNPTVATLTATHNAVWAQAGGASAPPANPSIGSTLHPNQRLTLTAGFAEITTARGAIAIIEAPATIEFSHNDNALGLHAGKLVGSCYSDSSKGFVVKTKYADITDIGTEFGVEVRDNNVTATVITGEIEMNVPGSAPQRLTQDQTAQLRVNGVNRKLQIKDQLAQGFEALLPRRRLAEALRNDPAMIAYWGFEADDIVDGKLLNRAVATQGKMDGTLGQKGKPDSSPTLTEGRSPGTKALRFEAEEFDLVRVSQEDAKAIDGLEQFTIGLWLKPDHMDQMSHHLVTKRAAGGGDVLNFGLCWDGRPGSGYALNTVFFEGRKGQSNDAEADSLHRRSAWMHLVVTYDRGERSIYLDGALIERLPRQDVGRLATIDAELLIGAATPHLSETGAYLDGDLDELFILGRSMSHEEITTLYETGVTQP